MSCARTRGRRSPAGAPRCRARHRAASRCLTVMHATSCSLLARRSRLLFSSGSATTRTGARTLRTGGTWSGTTRLTSTPTTWRSSYSSMCAISGGEGDLHRVSTLAGAALRREARVACADSFRFGDAPALLLAHAPPAPQHSGQALRLPARLRRRSSTDRRRTRRTARRGGVLPLDPKGLRPVRHPSRRIGRAPAQRRAASVVPRAVSGRDVDAAPRRAARRVSRAASPVCARYC